MFLSPSQFTHPPAPTMPCLSCPNPSPQHTHTLSAQPSPQTPRAIVCYLTSIECFVLTRNAHSSLLIQVLHVQNITQTSTHREGSYFFHPSWISGPYGGPDAYITSPPCHHHGPCPISRLSSKSHQSPMGPASPSSLSSLPFKLPSSLSCHLFCYFLLQFQAPQLFGAGNACRVNNC